MLFLERVLQAVIDTFNSCPRSSSVWHGRIVAQLQVHMAECHVLLDNPCCFLTGNPVEGIGERMAIRQSCYLIIHRRSGGLPNVDNRKKDVLRDSVGRDVRSALDYLGARHCYSEVDDKSKSFPYTDVYRVSLRFRVPCRELTLQKVESICKAAGIHDGPYWGNGYVYRCSGVGELKPSQRSSEIRNSLYKANWSDSDKGTFHPDLFCGDWEYDLDLWTRLCRTYPGFERNYLRIQRELIRTELLAAQGKLPVDHATVRQANSDYLVIMKWIDMVK